MVYKSAMKDFEYHIMLSVSQQFSQTNLLLKMLKKFDSIVPDNTDEGELIMELKDNLSRSKYLIILDDVWEVNLWNQLKNALPDNKNGSRVLMTSRFIDVAKSADPGMPAYELDFLNDKESRDLLLKKAFFYQELDEEYPNDLLEIADELAKKCKGLPLALIVLGGILSTKDHTHSAWERVLRTMDWQSDGRGCMDVLAMSYDDMPYYLKTCFLYLASFPEDYKISSKRLIKMWIAEGFIPCEGRKSMEEIAEDCLEKLFQRCMIQVSSRHLNGLIRKCRVHDLLRDLAMYQAGKENFITVLPNPQDTNYPDTTTRRVSFQSCHPQLIKYVGPNTRSLLYFFPKDVPKYNEFRLLKVLELVGVDIPVKQSLTGLDKLIHLKYLGFRKCSSNLTIPVDSLGCLKNLETLDLRGISAEGTIPSNLWEIDALRHVFFAKHDYVVLPPNAYLRNLQTIKWVKLDGNPWPVHKIPCLTSLRRLSLVTFSQWDNTIHLLGTLPHLISLKITAYMEMLPNEIVYPRMLPNYQNLQTLFLEGRWPESVTLEASLLPPHLIKLTLSLSFLFHDPMEELGKLTSLKELRLREYVYLGKKMVCSAGFTNLERLEVDFEETKVFTVAKGVMPKLKYLDKSYDLILELPPELMHLDKDIMD
ncbi:Disease resistance family protein [Rhynchospora pubera]|uniref:Disease resistance family protein n=1 Tax=Rhynchospora pubera TaxID=906938 RepID=A0AAV8EBD0_9POAL|nr:Disease resistance family protein [Rhynchospora pubera]